MHRLHRIRMNAAVALAMIAPLTWTGCAAHDDRGSLRTVNLGEFAAVNNDAAEHTRPAAASSDQVREELPAEAEHGHIVARDLSQDGDDQAAQASQPGSEPGADRAGDTHMSGEDREPLWPGSAGAKTGIDDAEPIPTAGLELYATSDPETRRRPFVVESLVGQVNGRPIYADSFFQPIEDQLIAESRRAAHEREFVSIAHNIVSAHLREIILNELFLAEAQSQLTTEQQHGLIAMMRMMREEAVSLGGGARAAADHRWQEMEGITVEEYVEAQRDVVLLRELQRRKIQPRVIVSWRDIEREYQRRYDQYNPPASVKIARIRLHSERDADRIDEVTQRFESGESFAEIAQWLGLEQESAWQEFQLDEEGLAGIPLSENIRKHLVGLDVGETSEPFEVGTSTWWLHVSDMERPEGRSLYDPYVQREIKHSLKQRRFHEEMNRYIDRLLDEGIYDEIETMRERLIIIAVQRYGP